MKEAIVLTAGQGLGCINPIRPFSVSYRKRKRICKRQQASAVREREKERARDLSVHLSMKSMSAGKRIGGSGKRARPSSASLSFGAQCRGNAELVT